MTVEDKDNNSDIMDSVLQPKAENDQVYLDGRALVGERAAEEGRDYAHQAVGHVVLQSRVGVIPIVGSRGYQAHVDDEGLLE